MDLLFSIDQLPRYASIVIVLLLCMPVHDYAHAKVATILGDNTPSKYGRLTLNPAAHLDVLGTLAFLVFGFGWTKYVKRDFAKYKYKKLGRFLTAMAGPLCNFIFAFIFTFIYHSMVLFGDFSLQSLEIIRSVVNLNITIVLINIVPFIAPLDGGDIFTSFLSGKSYQKFVTFIDKMQGILAVVLLAIVYFSPILNVFTFFISNSIFQFLSGIALKILGLFVSIPTLI